jgi:hypothetical protein
MFTAQEIINRVRVLLKDVAPFRWEEAELLVHIDDGQVEIQRRRPDSFYTEEVAIQEPQRVTSADTEIPLDRHFITCMTDWVMHRALLKDAEEASVTRSNEHLNLFLKHLR